MTNATMTNATNATNATTALATDDELAFVPWVLDEVCEDVPEILLRPGTCCEPISVVALALLVYVAFMSFPLLSELKSAGWEKAKKMFRARCPCAKDAPEDDVEAAASDGPEASYEASDDEVSARASWVVDGLASRESSFRAPPPSFSSRARRSS